MLPVELYPLMRWRMAREHQWPGVIRIAVERAELVEWVRDEVAVNGPVTAAQMEADVPSRRGNWGWNWSDVKIALEYLFWRGEVLVSGRNTSFARLYDLPERVLPARVLADADADEADAMRAAGRLSARALGVANEAEIRDYFRLPVHGTRAGDPRSCRQRGADPGRRSAATATPLTCTRRLAIPRRVSAATLVSPFDPIVWNRGRSRAPVRVQLPHRDLRAGRRSAFTAITCCRSCSATGSPPGSTSRPTGRPACCGCRACSPSRERRSTPPRRSPAELVRLAGWLGLSRVDQAVRGDLARALNTALRSHDSAGPAGVP